MFPLSAESQAMDHHSSKIPAEAPLKNGKITEEESPIVKVLSHLPQLEAPVGLTKNPSTGPNEYQPIERSVSVNYPIVVVSSIGMYLHNWGNSFSAAIVKQISSLKETGNPIMRVHLPGVKVIVRLKEDEERKEDYPTVEITTKTSVSLVPASDVFFSRLKRFSLGDEPWCKGFPLPSLSGTSGSAFHYLASEDS